jgi:hypothetical protein
MRRGWLPQLAMTSVLLLVVAATVSAHVSSVSATQSDLVMSAISTNNGSDLYGTEFVVDKYGFIYVAGEFLSGSLSFGQRTVKHSDPAIADDVSMGEQIFVVKYSQTGVALWATKLYSNIANSRLNLGGIGVDNKGNLFVAGTTNARVKFGFAQFTPTGGTAGFIATMKTEDGRIDGGRLFNSGAAGTSGTYIDSLHVDSSGAVYIAGSIRQNAIFTKPNGNIVVANPAGVDSFVAKLTNLLDAEWVSTRGATGDALGLEVETDAAGNVYVAGRYFGTPEFNGIVMGPDGCSDDGDCSAGFVEKLSKDGQSAWIKSFGGAASSIQINDMSISASGRVLLVGTTNEIKAAPESGKGAFGKLGYSGVPTFLVSIGTDGVARWLRLATYQTGSVNARASFESVVVDRFENVYASLAYQGSASYDGVALSSTATNTLLIKISSTGEHRWTRNITTQTGLPAFNGFNYPGLAIYRDHLIMLDTLYGPSASADLGPINITRGADLKADLILAKFESNQAMQVKARNRNAVVSWAPMAVGSDIGVAKYRVKVVGTKKRCLVNVARNKCRIRGLQAGAKHVFRIDLIDANRRVISTDETPQVLIGVQQKTQTLEQNRGYTAKELIQLSSKGRVRIVVESGGCAIANKTLTATGAFGTECRVKFIVGKNGEWPKMTTSFDFFII